MEMWGFPGSPGVKHPPGSAGDVGLVPGPGRSHMSGRRSPTLLKPVHLEPVLRNKGSHLEEKPCPTTRSSPCPPQWRERVRSGKDPARPRRNKSQKERRDGCVMRSDSGSRPGVSSAPGVPLTMTGDDFGHHGWDMDAAGIWWVVPRDCRQMPCSTRARPTVTIQPQMSVPGLRNPEQAVGLFPRSHILF